MRTLLAIALMLSSSGAWAATTTGAGSPQPLVNAYYVSTTGNDSTGTGTQALPFATLGKCQTAIQGSLTKKGCYIRGGTYTGANLPAVTPAGSTYNTPLYLTSGDNGETWSSYPAEGGPTGNNPVILDGGATTANAGVYGSQTCTGGTLSGIWIDGGNNITINGLLIRNFNQDGIIVHGGVAFGAYTPVAVGSANNNLIANNILSNMCPENSGDVEQKPGAIFVEGQVQNLTITHNAVYNVGTMGIRINAGNPGCGRSCGPLDNMNGLLVNYNAVYKTCLNTGDCGAIYYQDGNMNLTTETGLNNVGNPQFLYNYIGEFGPGGGAYYTSTGIYFDDGASNYIVKGNVAGGTGGYCYFVHGGHNQLFQNNICDLHNGTWAVDHVFTDSNPSLSNWLNWDTANGNSGSINLFVSNDIIITNTTTGSCTINPECPYNFASPLVDTLPTTLANNGYYDYGTQGTANLVSLASQLNDTNPVTITSAPFNTCPTGKNSWSYTLNSGLNIFSTPVSFPAQPAAWGTAGFWGPLGYAIQHTGTTPSYGPTC